MNRSVILARQLAMVVYIYDHPGTTTVQLAQHFGQKVQTVRADIEVLDRAGIGDLLPRNTFELNMDRYLTSGELEVISNLQVTSAPRLTSREAAALLLGLRALAPSLAEEQIALVPGLIAQVLALAGQDGHAALSLVQVVPSNLPVQAWRLLRRAIRERTQVQLTYLSSAERESSRRIDPLRLERCEWAWVVHAWCHEAGAARTFRLDRIIGIEELPAPQDHGRMEDSERGEEYLVTLAPHALWRAGELPAQVSANQARVQARFRVWDREWMVSRLLSLAPDIEAVEPQDLQCEAAARAREALALWASSEGKSS